MIVHRYRLFSFNLSATLSFISVVLVVGIAITSRVSYAFVLLPSSMSKYQSLQMNNASSIPSVGRESMEPLQTHVKEVEKVDTNEEEDINPPKRRGRPGIVVFSGGT